MRKEAFLDELRGRLILTDVIASDAFHLERDTGSIEFNRCDTEGIYVKTDTGHVSGTLLSGKVFSAKTDTGKVDVPDTASGGRCEIKTDTGNIKIEIE